MLWREKLLENGDCGERRIVSVAASSVDKSRVPIWRPRGFPARERESPHDVTAAAEFDLVDELRNLPWAKVQK